MPDQPRSIYVDEPLTPSDQQAFVDEPATPHTALDTAKDVGIGAMKGAAHTALDAASLVRMIPTPYGSNVGAATDAIGNALGGVYSRMRYGTTTPPVNGGQALDVARRNTAYSNGPQLAGGALETLAEGAIPVTRAADAIPSAARAGQRFQSVMAAAHSIPIDVNGPGQTALRIQQLAERGGSMPLSVRKFLNRVTDPKLGPMTYEEARDFASNISRLSANEYGRLTPVVAREVATLRETLNKSVADAAKKAGKLDEYTSAMREYAKAAKLRDVLNEIGQGAKRAFPYAGAAGAGAYLMQKAKDLFGE